MDLKSWMNDLLMSTETIKFITWNVNGLKEQREQKLTELRNSDVVFLQETHIGEVDDHIINRIEDEWHIFYTKYTPSQKGTAILVRKTLDFEFISVEKDNCGGYVVLKCKLKGQLYTLVTVYNHHSDTETLEKLARYLQSMTTGLLVIGGDFNTVLNPFIDKNCNTNKVTHNRTHGKLLSCVKKFMKSLQLVDIWRRKNPVKQNYTFHRGNISSRLDYFFTPEECLWRVTNCDVIDLERPDHQPLFLKINNVSTDTSQKNLQIQSLTRLSHKHLMIEMTASSLVQERELSEVDIVSALHSLQVSDTPRPDGIPVSFYKENIQVIIPYIKMLYNMILSGTFNCSERRFNESVRSPHDNSQQFFNVDYIIIATILARRLEDFLESQSEGRMPKESVTVLVTPKTLHTQTVLDYITEELGRQRESNPNLFQDFRAATSLAGNVVDTSVPCQGCPLTPVLITLALKCYASQLFQGLENPVFYIFKLSVIVCFLPEDQDRVHAIVRNRSDEEYDIVKLHRGNVDRQTDGAESYESDDFMNVSSLPPATCKMSAMYAVVTLQDTDEVMVTPSKWLNADKTQCHWPPFRSTEKLMEAIENRHEPSTAEKTWDMLNIIFHAEDDNFKEATKKQDELVKSKKERPSTSLDNTLLTSQSTQTFGVKRKHDDESSLIKDMVPWKTAKRIMERIKLKVQATQGTDNTTTTIKTHILDAISKMDKDRKKATIGIFGRTGEGKSSLLNAVLGDESLLPSGGFGACTAVIIQVEANLNDSNYIAEIEFISKEEWENEIASPDNGEDNQLTEIFKERIIALYGADAENKTLEELKRDDKYTDIDNVLTTGRKKISRSDPSEFVSCVSHYVEHNVSNSGGCFWPLVKSVTIKIPNCRDLMEHIVLVDIPGTGDCDKIRDDLWKTKIRECTAVWIVSDIKRAVTDRDPWGILDHCIEDLGPGGECKHINFICTKTDDMKTAEYLRSTKLTEAQIPGYGLDLKTKCTLHRNDLAKKSIKQKLGISKSEESKERFIIDVFTVSATAFFDENSHLKPSETEIPKLKYIMINLNKSINQKLNGDYINEAKGVLSLIQSVQLDKDKNMTKVLEDLQKNIEKELKLLDVHFKALHENLSRCLSKGVEESVRLSVKTTQHMLLSVRPKNNKGFHRVFRAMCVRGGSYWPRNWNEPLDLNKCLSKHMYDNITKEFELMFPVDDTDKTVKSMQDKLDKFSIIKSFSPTSPLLHAIQIFIKTQETKLKASLSRYIVEKKKEIYFSVQTTIRRQMAPGYETAGEIIGDGAMQRMENVMIETIEQLKHRMFNEGKVKTLQAFNELKLHVMTTLESELKRSMERMLSQTSKITLMDVSREIQEMEELFKQ
ncbi:nuclear GTPase SLIP-GC-like isoform X2 [Triplophysa dalaica]|uniref:nuclear GTPase SLIP-GC-like isoform X2 n=1 Tax=Triplophysa dalaica TaxID=1582913 RepID=UPI0024DFF8C1|nr:nuclear GTPase SLIP-GC-like isoform X2 [Triplophysa dalaica]